jgi:N-acetylmuramoyl-L-alanine amidase
MKKILLWCLFLIIIASLSGCASISKNESSKSETSSTQEVDENKTVENDQTEDALEKESQTEETKNVDKSNEENGSNDKVKEEAVVNKKIVVIDPGHSSNGNKEMEKQSPDSDVMKIKDPGGAQGVSTGTPEYVVAMSVSLKLKSLLEQHGVTVIMTKTKDSESPGNIERAETGNNNNADLAIRIHCDSADSQSARGASMLTPAPVGYAKNISAVSKQYGQVILNDLVSTAGMNNRGVVERSDLTGFNWSKVPVVLIEMGFMSNPQEDRLLNDDNYQNKLAEGLSKGIIEALGI